MRWSRPQAGSTYGAEDSVLESGPSPHGLRQPRGHARDGLAPRLFGASSGRLAHLERVVSVVDYQHHTGCGQSGPNLLERFEGAERVARALDEQHRYRELAQVRIPDPVGAP